MQKVLEIENFGLFHTAQSEGLINWTLKVETVFTLYGYCCGWSRWLLSVPQLLVCLITEKRNVQSLSQNTVYLFVRTLRTQLFHQVYLPGQALLGKPCTDFLFFLTPSDMILGPNNNLKFLFKVL